MGYPWRRSRMWEISFHGHRDGLSLDTDGKVDAPLRRYGYRLAPLGLFKVTERGHDAYELCFWLELPPIRSSLVGAHVVLLTSHQVASERLGILVEKGEEVRVVEGRDRLQLVHPHHDGRRTASGIRVGCRRSLD